MALADSVILANDPGFMSRVLVAAIALCEAISTEGETVPLHYNRARFAAQIMSNPSQLQMELAQAVASDSNVIYAATYGLTGAPNTPTLTTGNVAAQAASILDSIITTSIAANFNAFFAHV
jgi:hypothetical protein